MPRNMSKDTGFNAEAFSKFVDFLKEGSNEDSAVLGETPDVDPVEQPSGNMDAPPGKPDGSEGPDGALHFGDAVRDKFRQGREELLAKYFNNFGSAKATAGADAARLLEAGARGHFESSDPALKSNSKMQKVSAAETIEARFQRLGDL
jgi:hypothetical protein